MPTWIIEIDPLNFIELQRYAKIIGISIETAIQTAVSESLQDHIDCVITTRLEGMHTRLFKA